MRRVTDEAALALVGLPDGPQGPIGQEVRGGPDEDHDCAIGHHQREADPLDRPLIGVLDGFVGRRILGDVERRAEDDRHGREEDQAERAEDDDQDGQVAERQAPPRPLEH